MTLSKFIDEEVLRIVRTSTTYKHFVKSRDHDEFTDIKFKQLDTLTASILCYLKNKHRKDRVFTQTDLNVIAKLAARNLLIAENKYKSTKISA
jgi:hypothetical protein